MSTTTGTRGTIGTTGAGAAAAALAFGLALVATGALGCGRADELFCGSGMCGWSQTDVDRVAALGGLPEVAPADSTNAYEADPAAQALGRKLFWDTRFSGTSSGTDAIGRQVPFARAAKGQPINIACVTCHDLRRGGIDPSSVPGNVSIGAGWSDTNAGTVFNDGFQKVLLWNGRSDSLWGQAAGVMETAMGSNRLRVAWTIASLYRAEYEAVFTGYPLPMASGAAPDARFPADGKPGKIAGCQAGDATEPFGDAYDCMATDDQTAVTRAVVNFGKAVAAFEALLISRNSPFDRFVADLRAGRGDTSTEIPAAAKNGARLFVGKAGCADCHNTPLMSDGNFYNVGVPQIGQGVPTMADCPKGGVCDCVTPKNCLPFGAPDGIAKLRGSGYRRDSMWSDDQNDQSRKMFFDLPMETFVRGAFRTPSLRDAALTAPYMHTGSFTTLEAVVAHYNRGGDPDTAGPRAARIKPLFLTQAEQSDLVAFLKSLTGAPLPSELADKPELPQ